MSDAEILIVLRSIDGRRGGIETRLGRVETRLELIETRLGNVEGRLGALETGVVDVATRLETVTARAPDLRLIGHQLATLIDRVNELEASNVRAIAALNDIARESVTPGEVEALHSGIKEFRTVKFDHKVRLRQIESEQHLAPSA